MSLIFSQLPVSPAVHPVRPETFPNLRHSGRSLPWLGSVPQGPRHPLGARELTGPERHSETQTLVLTLGLLLLHLFFFFFFVSHVTQFLL